MGQIFLNLESDGTDLKAVSASSHFPKASAMRGSVQTVFDSIRMNVPNGEMVLLVIEGQNRQSKSRVIDSSKLRNRAKGLPKVA